jgi:hypothetical protein
MRPDFRQALADDGKQRRRSERFAQAARRAEPGRHLQEVGTEQLRARKCRAGNGDQRHGGRMVMKNPDRLEPTHLWHNNIDDHQIEG